jgi:hypothetical protein
MSRKKLPYKEGDWFAVPLRDSGYALGLVARMDSKGGVIGYFFGPRREQLPTKEDVMGLSPADAVLVCLLGDLGLVQEEWPIIYYSVPWNRDEWPMPAFARVTADRSKAWRVEYSDVDLSVLRVELATSEEVSDLPKDGSYGSGAVEIRLTKLLSPDANEISCEARASTGTWGVGIFNDDVALDVRDAFEDALSDGFDVPAATRRVLREFAERIEDIDDGPVIYLALTALQLERGSLQPEIREQALRIIATSQSLARWEGADPAILVERKHVLEQLKAHLSAA